MLSVVEVKREGLDQADEYGSVVTTVFLVLGIFSLGAAILLIHLIFALLAADRGAELATLRSLGMGRRQITGIFLIEGVIYAILGAGLGALAGVFATRLTVASLAEALASFGYDLELRVEPRSIVVAFAAGALLTFAAMCVSAWRVSHTAISSRGRAASRSRRGVTAALWSGRRCCWRRRGSGGAGVNQHCRICRAIRALIAPGRCRWCCWGCEGFGGAVLRKLRTMRGAGEGRALDAGRVSDRWSGCGRWRRCRRCAARRGPTR
ncbi:MAG: ABC transporter permease [Thermomicrobiales bacterium]